MKKGVLLVNMGGAEEPLQLRNFLFKMFMDENIVGAPKFIRFIIAYMISRGRYKKSWKKYELIGGSPILKAGRAMAQALKSALDLPVEIAYSYSSPFIEDGINALEKQGATNITVIPLYPQASYTTSSSVIKEIGKLKGKHPQLIFNCIKEFSQTEQFVKYWVQLINTHIEKKKTEKPTLIFSAHSIPQSFVDKGDTYTFRVEENARVIAQELGLNYEVTFQSKFGPVEWYGRDNRSVILDLISKGIKEIIIVPISFISECLETIYDIDKELFTELKKDVSDDVKLSRIIIPYAHPILIETLKSLV